MSTAYTLSAEARSEQGKGASRRLRKTGGVPAVIYGGNIEPQSITLKQNELTRNLQDEAFYSQIMTINYGDTQEMAVLRDLQRHPAKPVVLHVDLQRVRDDEELHVLIPLHYLNEESAPGVKMEGGRVNHIINEVEVACLPKDLPQYLEVDMGTANKGDIVHLTDIKLPEGVSLPTLALGEDHNLAIAALA